MSRSAARQRLCETCRQRKANYRFRGRVRADRQHILCFACFRSMRDRHHAQPRVDLPALRSPFRPAPDASTDRPSSGHARPPGEAEHDSATEAGDPAMRVNSRGRWIRAPTPRAQLTDTKQLCASFHVRPEIVESMSPGRRRGTSRSRPQIVNGTLGTLRPRVRSVTHWGWRMG
jgi:hypothetical protein